MVVEMVLVLLIPLKKMVNHDDYRIDYHRAHQCYGRCYCKRGDLIGYTTWDVRYVSAGTGEMRKRYGFIYVDMDDAVMVP